MKHWWGIHFSQQVAGKAKIKNLSRVTPDLIISSHRKQAYVRKLNPAIYVRPSKRAAPEVRPPGSSIASYNPTGAWMSFSLECCVPSSRGLCDGLSLVQMFPTSFGCLECNLETSIMRRPRPKSQEKKYTLSVSGWVAILTESVC